MRTLTLSAGFPPFLTGGPAIHTYELNLGLARAGHEPWVVSFHPPEGPREMQVTEENGVHVCRVQNWPYLPRDYAARFHQQNVKALGGVLRIQAGRTFDLIVLQGYWLASAAMALREALDIPVVFHVHNMYSAPVPGQEPEEAAYFRELEGAAVREAVELIPISQYIAGMCQDLGADPSRLHVIPKGLHMDAYAGEWQPQDRQTLLFVGRLSGEKGLETLFEAVGLLRDQAVPVRLLLAGTGEEAYVAHLHQMIDSLNLRRNVAFLGFLGGPQLVSLYQKTTVTVVPSYMEALGRVALEAMAAGSPVIVTDVGGLGPLVRHGETGWKVKAHDAAALAECIKSVLEGGPEVAKIASSGREEVGDRYSWDKVLSETIAVYELATRGADA